MNASLNEQKENFLLGAARRKKHPKRSLRSTYTLSEQYWAGCPRPKEYSGQDARAPRKFSGQDARAPRELSAEKITQ